MGFSRLGLAPRATIGFALGFALWTWLTFTGALQGLDALQAPPAQWQNPAIQIAAAVAVTFHPVVVYGGLLGVAAWAYRRRLRNLTVAVVSAVAVGWGGHELLRQLFARERPPGSVPELITNQGYAYPSGHLVAAATGAVIAIAATTTTRQPRQLIEVTRWLGIVLIVVIGLDRWLLHAHWITDLVGGLLWGGFSASVSVAVARVRMRPERPTRAAALATKQRRRCAIVVNPTKIPDWAAFRRHVEYECRQNGATPMFLETSADDPGRGMTRAAIEAKADLVLVAGGDGTVRVVCSELSGTGIPLGLVPSGTGNLLARNLSIPLDESQALTVIFQGRPTTIDLVEVVVDDAEPEHIAVMAGMGLDARIMSGTDDALKKVIGPAAYVMAAGDAANLPSFDVTVRLDDDEPIERHAGLVMVGNVGQLQGNVQLLPDARFDDGLLDLFVASPSNVADWLRITTSVILPLPEASEIDRGQGRTVLIECTEPVEYQLDGDAAGQCSRMRATVVPQALTVIVPN
ncbi:bifunctional phosphatase PAP2/diacylglycerol kinase family protein [Micropruina sp.]|uniref:bifunctional phosphatase PAP2/diacylglycerol kinase family protein n=1 Tax=Micropruina sp. TaxID=2737536 RepID=UPI0039E313F3